MIRRSYLLAFAALGLASPAAQAQTPTVTVPPAPAIATPNDEPATNAAADYLVRAYGVTLTEAERRLRLQRAVSQLAVRLETQEADTFGDLYIKHRPDFGVTVNFTRDGAATLAKYVTDPELAAVTRAVEVSRTINELRRIQQETGTALDALQIKTSSLINAETGRITVFAPALSVIRQAVTTGVLRLPEIVDLVEKPLGKRAARDMTAGHPLYYYNGAPSCTTGFTVQRNGAYGVLTAGHCGDAQYHSARTARSTPFQVPSTRTSATASNMISSGIGRPRTASTTLPGWETNTGPSQEP